MISGEWDPFLCPRRQGGGRQCNSMIICFFFFHLSLLSQYYLFRFFLRDCEKPEKKTASHQPTRRLTPAVRFFRDLLRSSFLSCIVNHWDVNQLLHIMSYLTSFLLDGSLFLLRNCDRFCQLESCVLHHNVDFINETTSLVISAAGWTFDSTKTFCFLAIPNRLLGNVERRLKILVCNLKVVVRGKKICK